MLLRRPTAADRRDESPTGCGALLPASASSLRRDRLVFGDPVVAFLDLDALDVSWWQFLQFSVGLEEVPALPEERPLRIIR